MNSISLPPDVGQFVAETASARRCLDVGEIAPPADPMRRLQVEVDRDGVSGVEQVMAEA